MTPDEYQAAIERKNTIDFLTVKAEERSSAALERFRHEETVRIVLLVERKELLKAIHEHDRLAFNAEHGTSL